MKKIYLASPYSDPDPDLREHRFRAACEKAGILMAAGHIVFSPIAHSHPIAKVCDLPKGWDFWEKYDRTFIEWCDELWVLMVPGWETSKGIAAEIEIAMIFNKPIRHIPGG